MYVRMHGCMYMLKKYQHQTSYTHTHTYTERIKNSITSTYEIIQSYEPVS